MGADEIRLRRASEDDVGSMCRIMLSTDPYKRLGYSEEMCLDAAITSLEEGRALVALSGERVVGFVLYRIFEGFPLGGYVRALAVEDSHRGRGVGGALLRAAEQEIFRYRRNTFLLVSSFNREARRFYASQGYEAVGEISDAVIEGESEIIMRKRRP